MARALFFDAQARRRRSAFGSQRVPSSTADMDFSATYDLLDDLYVSDATFTEIAARSRGYGVRAAKAERRKNLRLRPTGPTPELMVEDGDISSASGRSALHGAFSRNAPPVAA
jgi:hypothetical protein